MSTTPRLRAPLTRRTWLRFSGGLGVGSALSLSLPGCAQTLFFQPNRQAYLSRAQAEWLAGVPIEVHHIRNRHGHRLYAAWLPSQGAVRGTVVHVHGNAANLTNHLPQVAWLPAAGYQVLTFDYQGYGASEGRPSLDGVVEDTLDVLHWVHERLAAAPQVGPVIVLGQSLGAATALRAVAQRPDGISTLVLEAPFASYHGVARDVSQQLPWWIRWLRPLLTLDLPRPEADPIASLSRLRCPLVVMVGSADRVVPPDHGRRLWTAADVPKLLIEVRDGAHVDALMRQGVRDLLLARWSSGWRTGLADVVPVDTPRLPPITLPAAAPPAAV